MKGEQYYEVPKWYLKRFRPFSLFHLAPCLKGYGKVMPEKKA